MTVPKSKRQTSVFETPHQIRKLRRMIHELALNDFGYDKDRMMRKIEAFAESQVMFDNKDEVIEKLRLKNESYYSDYVQEETSITRNMMRHIAVEFEIGNRIFPTGISKVAEYKERRLHLDKSISWLYALDQELQDIAETLPGDLNRYTYITIELDKLIGMIKGVRKDSNKYLKRN